MRARRRRRLLWLCAALPWVAQAETNAVTARIGTLGTGVEYAWGLSSNAQLRVGFNGASSEIASNQGGVDYNLNVTLISGDVLFDWHPFNNSFYTSLGALYNRNRIDATAQGRSGDITFNPTAPYVGIGWGTAPSAIGAAWMIDAGVVFQGAAQVSLHASSPTVTQTELDRETADLQDAMKRLKYYPHIGFSFGTRF